MNENKQKKVSLQHFTFGSLGLEMTVQTIELCRTVQKQSPKTYLVCSRVNPSMVFLNFSLD